MDSNVLERERGITILAKEHRDQLGRVPYQLSSTRPGHAAISAGESRACAGDGGTAYCCWWRPRSNRSDAADAFRDAKSVQARSGGRIVV